MGDDVWSCYRGYVRSYIFVLPILGQALVKMKCFTELYSNPEIKRYALPAIFKDVTYSAC